MKKYISFISLSILLAACGGKTQPIQKGDLSSQKAQIEKQIDSLNKILVEIDSQLNADTDEEVPEIEVDTVQNQIFTHYIDLQGNVNTDGNVMVIPEAMGSVKKIYRNEGDHVHKGQIIMVLDDKVVRNQISEVRTQYSLAKTTYERQKKLWDQKIGSEMAFLQAKTRKEALSKKLRTLSSQLAKFSVKAPISGTLDDMMIKEGEMAAPQRPVARVVNLDKVYMQADVSEKYLPQIKKGTQVDVYFPVIDKTLQSRVSYVGNFIHPNNRTFKIRVNLRNNEGFLKPNLTGNLKIKDFETDSAIVLPLSLVQEDRHGQNYVYVLEPIEDEPGIHQVVKRIIELGKGYQDKVMIETGLKAGEIIATQAARGLTEGDKVKIENDSSFQKQKTIAKQASDKTNE